MIEDHELREIYFDDTELHLRQLEHLATLVPFDLNEVKRIMHAMEGAAGVMGQERLGTATVSLCRRVVHLKSPDLLRSACCVLRDCNEQLRSGKMLSDSAENLVRKGTLMGDEKLPGQSSD